jgi:signal peptidase I
VLAPAASRSVGGAAALLLRTAVVLLLGVVTAVFGVTTVGIEGDSMAPTLHDGERALVPRYETWWLRATGRGRSPGDVVYFRAPDAVPATWVDRLTGGPFLIKRIAATAGATVGIERGRLVVDGAVVDEPYLAGTRVPPTGLAARTVPEGTVFVLGDNRAPLASRDSRAFGSVPLAQVAGRAAWVVWPPFRRGDDGAWTWNVRRL